METPRPTPVVEVKEKPRSVIASCTNCNWYSSLPSTQSRLVADMGLMEDYGKAHEERYKHIVKYKVN